MKKLIILFAAVQLLIFVALIAMTTATVAGYERSGSSTDLTGAAAGVSWRAAPLHAAGGAPGMAAA